MSFVEELTQLINKHSKENYSNTPDFILAKYMANSLNVFELAVNQRTQWYAPPTEASQ